MAAPEVRRGLAEFMALGGGIILQENVFRDSVANRVLLKSGVCPIGEPYEPTTAPGGDWLVTDPTNRSLAGFAAKVLSGAAWRLPKSARPASVKFTVKPWAEAVAHNEAGDPVVVVSTDSSRPVAYLAGSLEGTYIDGRTGIRDYPDQMAPLLYYYAELTRWLSTFSEDR